MTPSQEPACDTPRVTLGLPVCNGERFIRAAMESILSQTMGDFRLVVSDNHSTDATVAIVNELAARDPRVVLRRQPRNIGAGPNFDALVSGVKSPYFKWCAHDDVLAPRYLEETIAALDAAPEAVLCHSTTQFIDAEDQVIGEAPALPPGQEDPRPSVRLAGFIHEPRSCFEVFGLIRTDALARTALHLPFGGSDRALLVELLLQGRFVALHAPLFQNREHKERFSAAIRRDPGATLAWYDPSRATSATRHNWTLYRYYWRHVRHYDMRLLERLRCRMSLLRWALRPINAKGLARDVVKALPAPLAATLRAGKRRLVG